jgi:hypothetical protein
MQEHLYVMPTKELREERHKLAPHADDTASVLCDMAMRSPCF